MLSSVTTGAPSVRRKRSARDSGSGLAMLCGIRRQVTDKNFQGGKYDALMGGYELDLSQATIDGEARIEVFAMMGGIEITVPKTFTIESKVTALMGGYEDKTDGREADPNQRLVISGMALMGGVEVKN